MLWTYSQHNFAGGRLDRELMGRQDMNQYFKGSSELRNFVIRRQGHLSKRRGTNLTCSLANMALDKFRLIPFVFTKDVGYYFLMTGGYVYVVSSEGILLSDRATFARSFDSVDYLYRIESGIPDSDLADLDYIQSGDNIYFAHKLHKPFRLEFTVATMELVRHDLDFSAESVVVPRITKITQSGMSGTGAVKKIYYVATVVDSDGNESYMSARAATSYKLPWTTGGEISITVSSAIELAKIDKINLYKNDGSGFGWIGQLEKSELSSSSGSVSGVFRDDYITPDMSLTPPDKSTQKTFDQEGDYPSVVALYQQRLVFASSKNDPFTFWMSTTGDLYNFSRHAAIRDDDAITASLAATEQPEINHAILARELMFFADSGEWEVSPIAGNALSYKTISAKMQSSIGSARWVKPMLVGDEIVFVDATGERMLATRYNFASDGYESMDLTVLSQWMFRNNRIIRCAYRPSPDSTIHCVMEDGSVAEMVYMKEQEVCAWSRQDLGGDYKAKDVATAKSVSRGSSDVMYVVQKNGVYELWSERDDLPFGATQTVSDFVCMDRCMPLAADSVVPEGMKAVGLETARVYDAGDAVLEHALCGIPFVSKFESVWPEPKSGGDSSSTQIEILNATEAKVRVIDSSSFSIGACGASEGYDRLVRITPTAVDGIVDLPDRDVRVNLTGVNSIDSRVRITHDEPWPLNILFISITFQVEPANLNGGGNG